MQNAELPTAAELLDRHGRNALQYSIDRIAEAIRCGDDRAATLWDRLKVEIERELRARGEPLIYVAPMRRSKRYRLS